MNSLVLKKVETLEDFMILRNIRNDCRNFMTRDVSYISEEQQKRWYEKVNPDLGKTLKIFLLYQVEHGVISSPIGYGLLRMEGDYCLVSGGLVESCRGKGIGGTLFEYLVKNVEDNVPIKLEVLKSNTRAFVIYNKLGFRVISDDGEIITMEYHYDSQI